MSPMSQPSHLRDQLNLHFIVFIWGFTAILGRFISVDALALVFNRTGLTALAIGAYMLWKRRSFFASAKELGFMALCGTLIATHWITFFGAIKIANVSITLAGISTGALFSALLNPILTKSRVQWVELLLGALVVVGITIIFYEEPVSADLKRYTFWGTTWTNYQLGLAIALLSASLSASFSILNKALVARYPHPVALTFWEIALAFVAIGLYDLIFGTHNPLNLLVQSSSDIGLITVLALACTAYPFIKSVELLKRLSPFSVMLTINLEPVYGILLAALFFGAEESMNPQFYLGLLIILGTVLTNGLIKARKRRMQRL